MSSFGKKLARAQQRVPELPIIQLEDDAAFRKAVQTARERKTKQGAPIRGVEQFVACPSGEWHVIVSCSEDGETEHWHLSAMLWPPGRGSTTKDWESVGVILGKMAFGCGMPDRGDGKIDGIYDLTDEDVTPPDLPRHWCWHLDGSACDRVDAIKHALKLLQNTDKTRPQNPQPD